MNGLGFGDLEQRRDRGSYVGAATHLGWRTINLNEINIFENGFSRNSRTRKPVSVAAGSTLRRTDTRTSTDCTLAHAARLPLAAASVIRIRRSSQTCKWRSWALANTLAYKPELRAECLATRPTRAREFCQLLTRRAYIQSTSSC